MQYDVIIIGGGITGAGTARDCAMRGLKVLVIEKGGLASGATGRNHGLLHSGGRYVMKDKVSARECVEENLILRKIAPHCIDDCGGLFITLPEDEKNGYGVQYRKDFIQACTEIGLPAKELTAAEALKMEPSVNPTLTGAVLVNDASVDPFKLCLANMLDARMHGATILYNHEVTGLIIQQKRVVGVKVKDLKTGEEHEISGTVTVNAAGIWGARIAEMAGLELKMTPSKGTLLVFGHRVSKMVINRCRPSSDGDILVPGDVVSVIGTTSTKIEQEECDNVSPTRDEVELMLREGSKLCPALSKTRVIRAYSGVRPLVSNEDAQGGREISRGIVCIDHSVRSGIRDFITITGGKLMTYRRMAEKATDLVCRKLDFNAVCSTDIEPLPDPVLPVHNTFGTPELICECENIAVEDIEYAIDVLGATTLEELRKRTRLGMGTCQGTHCIRKAARIMGEKLGTDPSELEREYIQERWKGMRPVGWGDTLRQMELLQKVYKDKVKI